MDNEGYPLDVLRMTAVTLCTNPDHHVTAEFRDKRIVGADIAILCKDCCDENKALYLRTGRGKANEEVWRRVMEFFSRPPATP